MENFAWQNCTGDISNVHPIEVGYRWHGNGHTAFVSYLKIKMPSDCMA